MLALLGTGGRETGDGDGTRAGTGDGDGTRDGTGDETWDDTGNGTGGGTGDETGDGTGGGTGGKPGARPGAGPGAVALAAPSFHELNWRGTSSVGLFSFALLWGPAPAVQRRPVNNPVGTGRRACVAAPIFAGGRRSQRTPHRLWSHTENAPFSIANSRDSRPGDS